MRREAAYVQLLEHAATAANEAASLEAAMTEGLRRLCQTMGWVAGHIYLVNENGNLESSERFHVTEGQSFDGLRELTTARVLRPGEALAGRALLSLV